MLLQNFDELAIEAENSNLRVSVPRLSLPENIWNSSKWRELQEVEEYRGRLGDLMRNSGCLQENLCENFNH